ncbi:MAG: DUF4421 family protein [Alloprevotella sp.]|nr:DUF4421 family protein [Alloprevotella sp.]
MNKRFFFILGILLLCCTCAQRASAQGLLRKLKQLDSILTVRYHGSNIDTTYITRPQTKWTLKGRLNVSGSELEMDGQRKVSPFHSKIKSVEKTTISFGVNYLGIAVGIALNPAKLAGKYKDFELNINAYGNRWGFDVIYQDARNFKGWYEENGSERIDLPADILRIRSLNVNAYYAFNYRRFSYPAAFSQSYIQRRSAGSFMAAASAQVQNVKTEGDFRSTLKATNIGIGGGYGYNWVPGRNWLLHISALPTIIVYSHTSLKVNDVRTPMSYRFPEFIITTRGAVVRHFKRWFVGASMIYNFTNIGNHDQLQVFNDKWRTRVFVGFRL